MLCRINYSYTASLQIVINISIYVNEIKCVWATFFKMRKRKLVLTSHFQILLDDEPDRDRIQWLKLGAVVNITSVQT